MSKTKELVSAIMADDKSKADEIFKQLFVSRVRESLDVKSVELATTIYNSPEVSKSINND